MALDILHRIDNLLNAKGEECNFGCDESKLHESIQLAQLRYPDKGVCAVKAWSWWDFEVDEETRVMFLKQGTLASVIYSSYVIWDERERWLIGDSVKTSVLVNFEDNCYFITRSSVYILVGRGTRKLVDPFVVNQVHF